MSEGRPATPDPASPTGVAAFDFDGTLTRADSFVGFLRFVAGTPAVADGLARAAVASWGVPRGADPAGRDVAKAVLVRRTLTGRTLTEIEEAGRAYGARCAAAVTPRMRATLERHRQAGHLTVIVSASLEVYLRPAADRLGIDHVLGTRLEVSDGTLTGRLLGANCRGPEKAARLRSWLASLGLEPVETGLWCYGDSAGDTDLLAMASFPTRVRRGRPRSSPAGLG
ncbi:MAG TPA: HAD family hydrolase [Acidimicrobiales bacterium]|nr:HAD family hydrolase [Acidimicrobiales bacterium]